MSLKRKIGQMIVVTACIVGFIAAAPQQARAEWPEKPITIMVGYSAGGGTDIYARALASFIHEHMGQPMIVVNKPGAASMIAAKAVMDSRPDGYTLLMVNGGTFLAKAMMLGDKTPVDPLQDMQPLGGVGQFITALMVPIDSPFKKPQDLVAAAKANPGKLRWAHPGRGTINMMAGVLFLQENGITAQDVPFKSGPGARNASVTKQVDFSFTGIHNMTGFESKVIALAVSHTERDKNFKDVPAFGELGMPALGVAGPMVLWGHKDLPADVVTKLNSAVEKVAKSKGYATITKKAGASGFYLPNDKVLSQLNTMKTKFTPIVAELRKSQKKK